MTQAEFGAALEASHRSAVRWESSQASPSEHAIHLLVQRLLPVDRALAEEAASHIGDTLESLGLVPPPEPPPPPPPQAPSPPPPPPRPKAQDLVDIVVCAVANFNGAVPNTLRPMLYTAFRRAREIGLTVEEVEEALAPEAPVAPAPKVKAAKG